MTYPDVLVDREFIKSNQSGRLHEPVPDRRRQAHIDGSPQGFTAWRDRPYHKPVGTYPPGYVGYPAATQETVIEAIDWAFANNVQVLTHAMAKRR